MRNKLLISIIMMIILLSSCSNGKVFYLKNGVEVSENYYNQHAYSGNQFTRDTFEIVIAEPYGWGNSESRKLDEVQYEVCVGNVIWGIILCETIIMPVYFSGWSLYEPVRLKKNRKISNSNDEPVLRPITDTVVNINGKQYILGGRDEN